MFCINCGKKLNDGEKFCSNCGVSVNLQTIPSNLEAKQKTLKTIKILNIASSILNFILAGAFGSFAIYVLFLITGIITYSGSGGSGLIILIMPFAFIMGMIYLIVGICNLRINKNMNILSIRKISIIEICVGIFLQIMAIPMLSISIIRLILLSKLNK